MSSSSEPDQFPNEIDNIAIKLIKNGWAPTIAVQEAQSQLRQIARSKSVFLYEQNKTPEKELRKQN